MSFIRLEAENYIQFSDRSFGNTGGQGDRNDDVDIGYGSRNLALGWIESGEWLTYDLVISDSGNYKLSGLITSGSDKNFGFKASVAGQSLTATFSGTENWAVWKNVDADGVLALEAGAYELRLDMLSGGFNLDNIDLERISEIALSPGGSKRQPTVTQDSPALTAEAMAAKPILIEAEDYKGFFDRSAGNVGERYRRDDVDLFGGSDSYGVGWIESGEWLTYDVTIVQAGRYRLTSAIASNLNDNFALTASIGGQSTTVSFGQTGGWLDWQDAQGDALLDLAVGNYSLRLDMVTGGFNLDDVTLERVEDSTGVNADGNEADSNDFGVNTTSGEPSPEDNGTANDVGKSLGSVSRRETLLIEAEDYSAALDLTVGNEGQLHRTDDVDVGQNHRNFGVGWIQAGEWLSYNFDVAEAGLYQLTGSIASALSNNFGFKASIDGQSATYSFDGTDSWGIWKDVSSNNQFNLATGRYQLRLDMLAGGFNLDSLSLTAVASASVNTGGSNGESVGSSGAGDGSSSGATGDEIAAPTVITVEAEQYDRFYDRSPGNAGNGPNQDDVDVYGGSDNYAVGWIESGEWLAYDIEIPEAGTYQLDASTASFLAQAFEINASLAGQSVSLNFGGTGGWTKWQDVSANEGLELQAGRYELRLDIVQGGFNLDRFRLTKLGNGETVDVPLSSQRIQAELYQTALDRSPGNNGNGTSPNENVDVGGSGIGWIESDEWLSYEVNVPRSGTYTLSGRVASDIDSPHSFQAVLGGQSTVVEFGSTGGWDISVDAQGDRGLTLEAGQQVLRVNILSGGFNLDYFDLTQIAPPLASHSGDVADVSLNFGNIANGLQASGSANTLNYAAAQAAVQVDLSQNRQVTRPNASPTTPQKVLLLGDSLTEGFLPSDLGGYRDDLWTLLNQAGYYVDFVGNRSKGIGSFDRDHAGISGERIDEIALHAPALLTTYRPDAVLLMGGTNDLLQGEGAVTAYDRLTRLVDSILTQSPQTQLFLAAIPLTVSAARNQEVQQFNDWVSNLVAQRQASGESIVFVDVPSQLGIGDLEDGVHPSESGNDKLASAWFEAWQQTYGAVAPAVSAGLAVSGASHLLGSGFDDVLVGNAQDNIIQGGQGYDQLTGGAGRDRFILASNHNTDTITDFTLGQDLLVLDGGLTYGEVDVVSSGIFGYSDTSNAVVLDGQGQQLALLLDVEASQVGASSFGIAA